MNTKRYKNTAIAGNDFCFARLQPPGGNRIEIDGLSFFSIKDAAHHFGHPPNRIRNRVNTGLTKPVIMSRLS